MRAELPAASTDGEARLPARGRRTVVVLMIAIVLRVWQTARTRGSE